MSAGGVFSRRAFVARVGAVVSAVAVAARVSAAHGWGASDAAGGAALGAGADAAGSADVAAKRTPVVSFHLDQPYLDLTGQDVPYVPPAGCRAGDALAALDDADFFRCTYGA